MRIEFLGTSHGRPEPNRRCSCIMVEVAGERYLFDMGIAVWEDLITQGIAPESLKGIFITHMHMDHTAGLPSFLALWPTYYKAGGPFFYVPGDVAAVKAGIAAFLACNGAEHPAGAEYRTVTEGPLFTSAGGLRVTAYQTKHTKASYAYLLEAEGRRVLISGDLSHTPSADFPSAVLDAPLDLAICECAHFEATEYLKIFAGGRVTRCLCFTHYSERHLASVLSMQAKLPEVRVMRAQDGTVINL